MLRALSFLFLILSTSVADAKCSFKTGQYVDQLQDQSFIQKINIEVPKSGKFIQNALKILKSGDQNILPHLRKKFKANIIVSYSFGRCTFNGTVRQNGDLKDHIILTTGGQVIRSLDVKLKSGNILSAVSFKLLIPETRAGENEILTTLILKKMGMIAPETFSVMTEVNGVIAPMLFQEKPRKELLEKNLRREGPIFEGDEDLLFSRDFKDIGFHEKDNISLSKMENINWFKKGASSQSIVLRAYTRLQTAYANKQFDPTANDYVIYPNSKNQSIFDEYLFLLLAMGGKHALHLNNRKYYFNSITDVFEPIYYDGDVDFRKLKSSHEIEFIKWHLTNSMRSKIDPNFIKKLVKIINAPDLNEEFLALSSKLDINGRKRYNELIESLIFNVNLLKKITPKNFQEDVKETFRETGKKRYVKLARNGSIPHKIINNLKLLNDSFIATFESGHEKNLNVEEVSEVISENKLNGKRTVFFGNKIRLEDQTRHINSLEFPGLITAKVGIKVSVSKSDKLLTLTQTNQDDWVLIQSGDLSDWEILFIGVEKKAGSQLSTDQRFNKYGLTGCLNIHESKFQNLKVKVLGGVCEDSLNIINSKGSIKSVLVSGAFSDALDIDFSTVDLSQVNIYSAGNDCLDVSGGDYKVGLIDLANCSDKGVSVGEGSTLFANKMQLSVANIGVSSKDSSKVEIAIAEFEDVAVCIEVMQKKQEFGGATLKVDNLECDGMIEVDRHSVFKERLH